MRKSHSTQMSALHQFNVRKSFLPGFLFLLLFGGFWVNHLLADYSMILTIENNSGFTDQEIYFTAPCHKPLSDGTDDDSQWGYIDFTDPQAPVFTETGTIGNFELNVSTMSFRLDHFKDSSGKYVINFPEAGGGRLYFSFGDNFDQCGGFPGSGPKLDESNPVIIDTMEFFLNSAGTPNVDMTRVDYFGISFYFTATDVSTSESVSRGHKVSRDSIINALTGYTDSGSIIGNTALFNALAVTRTEKDGIKTVRVSAPKNMGYTHFENALTNGPLICSHFYQKYVSEHCWKPNRTFTTYDKINYANKKPVYYCKVSSDGTYLNIYTDSDYTQPYTPLPKMTRPCNTDETFPSATTWHYTDNDDPNQNDWGFIIMGSVNPGAGCGKDYGNDIVAMYIMAALARGVLHRDNPDEWLTNVLPGDPTTGESTEDYPIFYYGKVLHENSIDQRMYALSYDDVGGQDTDIPIAKSNAAVKLIFNAIKTTSDTASITMAVSPENSGTTTPTVGPHTDEYKTGETVDIEATAATGYHFTGWTVSGNATIADKTNKSTTATVTSSSAETISATITANFAKSETPGTLTMAVSPDNSGTTDPAIGDHTYNNGESVTITASAASGYHFTSWKASGDLTINDTASASTTAKLSGSAGTATAYFAASETPITVTMAVSPNNSGTTDPTTGEHTYQEGQAISVTATATTGYHFTKWSNSGSSAITKKTQSSTTVVLSGNDTLTANFEADTSEVTLTMAVSPTGGGTVTPGAGTHTVAKGESITITATPTTNYYFSGWSASTGANVNDVGDDDTSVSLDSDATVTALFASNPVTQVALGSVFEVTVSDVNNATTAANKGNTRSEIEKFESKPKIYALYTDPVKDKTNVKGNMSVVTKVNKSNQVEEVDAEWKKSVILYDKKTYKDKTMSIESILSAHPISGMNSDSMNVVYKTAGSSPIVISKSIYFMPPVIKNVTGQYAEFGDLFTVTGKFFGCKPPKVYVEIYTEDKNGNKIYKKKSCKVLKKDSSGNSYLPYMNAKRKINSSCMKVYSDDIVYNPAKQVGYSIIKVTYPKINTTKETVTGFIIVDNKVGMDAYELD